MRLFTASFIYLFILNFQFWSSINLPDLDLMIHAVKCFLMSKVLPYCSITSVVVLEHLVLKSLFWHAGQNSVMFPKSEELLLFNSLSCMSLFCRKTCWFLRPLSHTLSDRLNLCDFFYFSFCSFTCQELLLMPIQSVHIADLSSVFILSTSANGRPELLLQITTCTD